MTRLLVFDSGIGGLSVVREMRRIMPGAEINYCADDIGFPYGQWEGEALLDHIVPIIEERVRHLKPNAVVIACNTASTLILPRLRERLTIPIVGTVPAIKPAAERTRTGLVSVLATAATMRREYTRDLIRSFAQRCDVRLVGSENLAALAEAHIGGETVDETEILTEIEEAFVERNGDFTDTIVLACTHYPFLTEIFQRIAPWPVTWIDPAEAIARRVVAVVGKVSRENALSGGRAFLTSGEPWPSASRPLLNGLGLEPASPG